MYRHECEPINPMLIMLPIIYFLACDARPPLIISRNIILT